MPDVDVDAPDVDVEARLVALAAVPRASACPSWTERWESPSGAPLQPVANRWCEALGRADGAVDQLTARDS